MGVRLPELERGLTPWVDDVSTGGILIRANSAPPIGKALIAELCVPQWPSPLRVEARVVRVMQLEPDKDASNRSKDLGSRPRVAIALEFEKMKPRDAEKLSKLLSDSGRVVDAAPKERVDPDKDLKAELALQLERTHSKLLEQELERTKAQLKGALLDLQKAREEVRARQRELIDLREQLGRE